MRAPWRRVALAVVVLAALAGAVVVLAPGIRDVRSTVAGYGAWGPVVFAAVYAVVSLSPLPKTVFTLAAGALFGAAVGLVVVLFGATAGALLAFGLSRLLGRDAVDRLVRGQVARWDERLRRRGFVTVLVARLIPLVPFTALNYVAGVSRVGLRDFTLGTALGIVPASTAYVVLGAHGSRPGSWPFLAALGGLLTLTVGGLVVLSRQRRRGRPTDGAPRPAS